MCKSKVSEKRTNLRRKTPGAKHPKPQQDAGLRTDLVDVDSAELLAEEQFIGKLRRATPEISAFLLSEFSDLMSAAGIVASSNPDNWPIELQGHETLALHAADLLGVMHRDRDPFDLMIEILWQLRRCTAARVHIRTGAAAWAMLSSRWSEVWHHSAVALRLAPNTDIANKLAPFAARWLRDQGLDQTAPAEPGFANSN